MKRFRPLLIATASIALFISACSTSDDLTTAPTLEPQFGTRGYDEVTDVAYGKALTLYAVGTLDGRSEYTNYGYLHRGDAFVRRYDRSGNLVWESYLDIEPAYENDSYYYGYVPNLTARAVAVDGSGNALVAWSGEYRALVYNEVNNRSDYEVVATFNYLTKYSKSGSKVWRVYTNNALTDLATDSSGNIYATSGGALTKYTSAGTQSWTRSNLGIPNSVTVSSTNNVYIVRQDGAVVKYNTSGTRLWLKTGALDGSLGSGEYSEGESYKIAAGLSDELYVTGARFEYESEDCDESFFVSRYTMRAFKLSITGTRQWAKDVAYGSFSAGEDCSGTSYDSLSGLGVAADINGNVYIAGFQGDEYQDGFVAKYSRAGALAWKKAFGTQKSDTATSVASYDGSEVFVGGTTNGSLVHRQLGNGDAVMREVNSSGNIAWAR